MIPPKRYSCRRAATSCTVDGDLSKSFWEGCTWTDDFVDIEGDSKPRPRFRTRAMMQWDQEALYLAVELEEPHVWATLTEHDSVIFHDNDIEFFIDPDGDSKLYVELEVNALNTTWDLLLVNAYRDGGPAIDGFELKGLQTAVQVQGTLNDPSDEDQGWTIEVKIPWIALKDIAGVPLPPSIGNVWRLNLSRVQWQHEIQEGKYVKVKDLPEDNWVWSPQGVIDMHQPEQWGYLEFTE